MESTRPPAEESAEEELAGEGEDEERGRVKPGVIGIMRRQVSVAPPPAPVVPAPVAISVTARVVATWKAPNKNVPRAKRTARDGGLLGRRQSNGTVPAVGGCCGNALWWD